MTLTNKSVVVSTSLDQKSWVPYVWDQDKNESKCIRVWDKTETFFKWSWNQVRSTTTLVQYSHGLLPAGEEL